MPSQAPNDKPGSSLPVSSPTQPYWRKEKHPLDGHRSTAELPKTQDIVIIGAGFAGAACAYYVSKHASHPSTTVLEAREACSGATARNGGHLRPEPLTTFSEFADKIGKKSAHEIARFEVANARAVKELVAAENIDCDLVEVTSSNVYLDETLARAARQLYQELTQSDLGYHDVVKDFKFHEGAEAEHIAGVPGAKAVVTFPAASIWPYKLVLHLLSVAVSKGVNLQTQTPVLSISSGPDSDGYWELTTPRGVTKARQIIFATNGYTKHLLPEYTGSITPVRGLCSHIKAIGHQAATISDQVRTMSIKHSVGCYDYLISRPDGSIIVGGAWKVIRPGPKEYWYDFTDDSQLVPSAANYFDDFMKRTFATWKDEASEVDYLWTGIMGYTSDSMPHVGKVEKKWPGLFICAGFNGHGMPQVLLCAKGAVQMALEGRRFSDIGVPTVFETSSARLSGEC